MPGDNINNYPKVLERLKLDVKDLGAVMLPMEPVDIFGDGREDTLSPEDLYASDDPKKFWVQGDVSDKAHVTLLYGLLTPAYEQIDNVNDVLKGWVRPESLYAGDIDAFPSPYPDEKYVAIVQKIDDPEHVLLEAHQRLSYLPHVNTFPDYTAHFTLAYVRQEEADKWKETLKSAFKQLKVKSFGLDYGSDK